METTKWLLISIIIPVYNVAPYLEEALNSVIQQTYNNLEILIIDDGSTDGSGEICDRYALTDSRIVVFHQENRGLSAARNIGLDHATGELIAFLDSDDAYKIDAIETMLSEMQDYQADIVVCGFSWHDSLIHMVPTKADSNNIDVISTVEAYQRIIDRRINTAPWNKLYKRRIWEKLRFPEGKVYEGTYTVFDIFSHAKKIVISDKKLVMHRKRPGSICNTYSTKNIEDLDYAIKHCVSFVEDHTPGLFSIKQLDCLKMDRLCGQIISYLSYIRRKPKDIKGRAVLKQRLVQKENKQFVKHCNPLVQVSYCLVLMTPNFASILFALVKEGKIKFTKSKEMSIV